MSSKITSEHLCRGAVVYIRQSSRAQVLENTESQRRQYELVDTARDAGFASVSVIDDDLGRSGSGASERPGFQKLAAAVCTGSIGAVFCIEASRLSRNGRDWHHLIDLCALAGSLVIDLDGAYDPRLINDRLLLGLLCQAPHNNPYVVQPAMSGSTRNPLSTRVLSPNCLT